jgi:hypothetical protein
LIWIFEIKKRNKVSLDKITLVLYLNHIIVDPILTLIGLAVLRASRARGKSWGKTSSGHDRSWAMTSRGRATGAQASARSRRGATRDGQERARGHVRTNWARGGEKNQRRLDINFYINLIS